jgi:hypothetical protein
MHHHHENDADALGVVDPVDASGIAAGRVRGGSRPPPGLWFWFALHLKQTIADLDKEA